MRGTTTLDIYVVVNRGLGWQNVSSLVDIYAADISPGGYDINYQELPIEELEL